VWQMFCFVSFAACIKIARDSLLFCFERDWIIQYSLSLNVKLSLCLTKYHAIRTYPLLNQLPRHEDIGGVEV